MKLPLLIKSITFSLLLIPTICLAQEKNPQADFMQTLQGLANGTAIPQAALEASKEKADSKEYSEAEQMTGAATMLVMLGNPQAAIEKFKEVNLRYPNYGPGHYNLACTYARENQKAEALTSLSKAIKLDTAKYKKLASSDKDFSSINGTDEFQRLIK